MTTLIGTVTVFTHLNEDGQVTRVVVDDESHVFTGSGVKDGQPLSKKQAAKAIEQAEASDWPAWEFGY